MLAAALVSEMLVLCTPEFGAPARKLGVLALTRSLKRRAPNAGRNDPRVGRPCTATAASRSSMARLPQPSSLSPTEGQSMLSKTLLQCSRTPLMLRATALETACAGSKQASPRVSSSKMACIDWIGKGQPNNWHLPFRRGTQPSSEAGKSEASQRAPPSAPVQLATAAAAALAELEVDVFTQVVATESQDEKLQCEEGVPSMVCAAGRSAHKPSPKEL
mmetsp:Transcript_84412/g.219728  ORF Transcript_84412/g.219728 Transcript_84412/m.219728 type:complete len:218 (-) Transcript_84412:265-918(-)